MYYEVLLLGNFSFIENYDNLSYDGFLDFDRNSYNFLFEIFNRGLSLFISFVLNFFLYFGFSASYY